MVPDLARTKRGFEVTSNGVGDLVLEFAQVLALRGNSAFTFRSVPEGDQDSSLLARLDLENDFIHTYQRTGQESPPSIRPTL